MIEFKNDANIDDNNDENQINDSEKNETGSDSKRPSKRKQTFERKNIRNIYDDEKFGKDAKEAQKLEFERLKRVQEKEHNIKLQNLLTDEFRITPNHIFQPSNSNKALYPDKFAKIYPQLSPQHSMLSPGSRYKRNNSTSKQYKVVPDNCVIYLDDSDEDREIKRKQSENRVEVIEISDGEDDDDNVEDTIDQEKVDTKNVDRNSNGNILINVAHSKDENDFFLSEKISKFIKPHQVSGIRFLYENLIESKRQFKEADGFGCILAHSMGLGKTIQIIGFLDILFRCCDAKSTLVIVPINTLQNWQAEIEHWLPTNDIVPDQVQPVGDGNSTETSDSIKKEPSSNQRSFNLFVIKDCHKTIESRHAVIKEWMKRGGVMLLGYEMFRLLVTYRQTKTVKPKKKDKDSVAAQPKKKIFIDVDLEEKRNNIYQDFLKALVNPGPEVIICDEGHRIKNSEASISKALKAVRTHRRVVMTGYPLQNNLTEYWCMVDFVRPNYLGSKHEFNNMFQRPIENGQCVDSTIEDRKLMQGRAHVLHELLQGFVQRRSHAVLKANLPPKWEYVIMIRMSQIQRKLYSSFMEQLFNGNLYNWSQNSTLKIYAMCCKIWNHPDILFRVLQEKMLSSSDPDFDFDIEEEINSNSKTTSAKSKLRSKESTKRTFSLSNASASPAVQELIEEDSNGRTELDSNHPDSDDSSFKLQIDEHKTSNGAQPTKVPASVMSYSAYLEMLTKKATENSDNPYSWINERSWLLDNGTEYSLGTKGNSGKIVVFLSLLKDCLGFGDKMLLFSQSLLTLDVIEVFLKQNKLPDNSLWEKNKTYFRLDGSTSASERERMINSFNEPNSPAHLFLLSTRAGCLGINLIGANRVVVFDASWNPCHDCQAVCRVYRYGQVKPCFIYRLVTDNTMEKKIYDRQVTKQGISDRVVDESNPGQHFLRSQVQVLIDYEDRDLQGLTPSQIREIQDGCAEEDPILGRVLEKHSDWVTKVPFTHESLLIDRKDYRLTKREKRKAKESYERDKRQSLYYQKNSYSDYYIKATVPTTDGYMPPRAPIPPFRSSIIPNLSANSGTLPRFPSSYSSQYRANKNPINPPIISKSSSALMREIEQARLRCGYPKNQTPYPIAVSEDEEEPIIVRKKTRDNNIAEVNSTRISKEFNANSSDNSVEYIPMKPANYKPHTDTDSSMESRPDKGFKVIKITATTELNFPSTPSIVTSQAGGTKIPTGEPLEIIYTSKGKFLRVPRTGDLFAIKDNKERLKHASSYPKLSDNVYEGNANSSSSDSHPDAQLKQLLSSADNQSSSLSSSLHSSIPVSGYGSAHFHNGVPSSSSLSSSPPQQPASLSGLDHPYSVTNVPATKHPSSICCPCQFADTSGLNALAGCHCPCHPHHQHRHHHNGTSPFTASSSSSSLAVPSSLYQTHSLANPSSSTQLLFDQRQQHLFPANTPSQPPLPPPQFTPSPYFFTGDKSLLGNLISTPVVVNSTNHHPQWQHLQLPQDNATTTSPVYCSFEFSDV